MIISLNDEWLFSKEGNAPAVVTLPHDAMLTEKRSASSRGGVGSGFFPGGKYRYEKTVDLTEQQCALDAALLFEGVYRNATVFVNGQRAAFHAYGYSEFSVNISPFVHAGENQITVLVDNSLTPNCRWYSGSGIYRNVWLRLRGREHIENIRIRTLSHAPAVIEVSAESQLPVKVEIYDGDRLVASGAPGVFALKGAALWTAETPKLYRCHVFSDKDEVNVPFGIRTIAWSAQTGLLINGQRVLLRGGCIHHDNGVLGACEYDEAAYRRVKILKEQGFNALRMSHNPCSRALLKACDELGMYVMDEAFDGWYIPKDYHDFSRQFYEHYEEELEGMVRKDLNHPSVILYSIGNELTEAAEEKGVQLAAHMRDVIRNLDESRPVTCGINLLIDVYAQMGMGVYKDKGDYRAEPLPEKGSFREKKSGSAFFNAMANRLGSLMFFMSKGRRAERIAEQFSHSVDILGLNYGSSRYDRDATSYPDRIMLGTETIVSDLPYNWERVKRLPQLTGDFVWAAWDYLGEACIGDWTYHSYPGLPLLAGQGMIDITGKPLAAMTYMQVVWGLRRKPFIAVRPVNHAHETPSTGAWQFTNAIDSWSWQGFEGTRACVEVYADAARIRLLLNGRTLAEKPVKNCRALFRVKYQPGTLRAEALDESGAVIGKSELVTSEEETVLAIKADKAAYHPDELIFAEIEFTDPNGELKPYIEQRVEIEVDGARLLGFGSALCKTDEVFDKPWHNSYRGRCLAVLKMGRAAAVLTVRSEGVQPTSQRIEVK